MLAAFAKAYVFAKSDGCGVVLIQDGRRGLKESKFSGKLAQIDGLLRCSAHADEFRFGSVESDERAACATPGDNCIIAGESVSDTGVALRENVGPGCITVAIYDARKVGCATVLSAVSKWKGFTPLEVAENLFGVGQVSFSWVGQVAGEDGKGIGDFGYSVGLEIEEATNEFLVGFLEGGRWVEMGVGEQLEGLVGR